MTGISKKLQEVIGDKSINLWAENHGLAPQTVHEWIKNDRMPRSAGLSQLVNVTGIDKEWWLSGGDEPAVRKRDDSYEKVQILDEVLIKNPNYNSQQSVADYGSVLIDYFVDVKGSAGPGYIIDNDAEEVVLKVRMDARLLRERAGNDFKRLKMAGVSGDSMIPTLSHGDQVVIDTHVTNFIDDAIYAILQDGYLRYKRIQKRLDGSIVVKSDNPSSGDPEIYSADEASYFHIVGMVIPFKFGRFKI